MRFLTILISQDISAVRRAALLQQRNRRRAPDATEGDGAEEGGETETDPGATQAPAKDEDSYISPRAVVIDEGNRMYVVAKGCYGLD